MQFLTFRAAGEGTLVSPFILEHEVGFKISEPFMIRVANNYAGFKRDVNYFKLNGYSTVYLLAAIKLDKAHELVYKEKGALEYTLLFSDKNNTDDGPFTFTQFNGLHYLAKMQVFEESGRSSDKIVLGTIDTIDDLDAAVDRIGFYTIEQLAPGILFRYYDDVPDYLTGRVYLNVYSVNKLDADNVEKYLFAFDESGKNARGTLKLSAGGVQFVSLGEAIYTIPDHVESADKDGAGNVIVDTYATEIDGTSTWTNTGGSITYMLKAHGQQISSKKLQIMAAGSTWAGLMTSAYYNRLYNEIYDKDEIDLFLLSKENQDDKGQPYGYAPLDGDGKIPLEFIKDSILSKLEYVGTFDPNLGAPARTQNIVPERDVRRGDYFISIGAADIGSVDFEIGDWLIIDGPSAWQKIDNTDAVKLINGKKGVVILYADDIAMSAMDPTTVAQYINALLQKFEEPLVVETKNILWADLVTLRDAGVLTPGQQYRITDFVTTTAQADTQSAGHAFDIIVTADDVDKLNENARACLHEGDTYFADSKLEAWQLKYCLDNDTSRFAWADEANGKGVVYRMIDEWNNDCPYDFKNIQFKRDLFYDGDYDITFTDIYFYTFSAYSFDLATVFQSDIEDATIITKREAIDDFYNYCYANVIRPLFNAQYEGTVEVPAWKLNNNIFINRYMVGDTYFGCQGNTFGDGCFNNTFGNSAYGNTFGNYLNNNTFGNSASSNTFGEGVRDNTFGNDVQGNSFGNDVWYNSFGSSVTNNSFGNSVSNNSFGNNVNSNSFGNEVSNNSFGDYFWYNTVKNNVRYVRTSTTGYSNRFQYVTLESGLLGASDINLLNLDGIQAIVGNNTPIKVARGTGTEIVAVWQNGTGDIVGKYKNNNLDNSWKTIPQEIDGGTF